MRKFNVLAGILCAFLLSSMLSATFIATALPSVDSNATDSPRGTSQPALSPTKLWSFTVVNSSWNDPPVIANGIAYVFNTKTYTKPSERYISIFGPPSHPLVTIYALNDSDGSKLWEYTAKGDLQLFTVVNGTAYFSTTDYWNINRQYSGAYLYALDAFSGAEKWVYYVDGMIFGSKFDSGNGAFYVFFVASGSLDSFVSAVNVTSGKEIWRYKFGCYTYPIPVAIGEGAMYFGVDNCFYALNTSDGEIVWSATMESSIEDVAPVLGDDVVYFNSQQMTHALNTQNGSPLWNYSRFSYPISSNGVGYVRDGEAVYAYDGVSGNKVWSYSANETIWSLQLFDNVLYVCLNGTLTALDATDGAQLWNYSLPEKLRFIFSPYYSEYAAHLLVSEDNLFCYSGKTLRAIDISNGKTLWDYTDYDRAFLTVVGGLAFFKTAHTIYAYSIPDIMPSPLQSPTTQPEESFKYTGLAIEAWIIVSIVGVTTALLIVFLAKKRIQEKKRALNSMEVAS